MSPVSATYLGIPGYMIFWVLSAIAVGLFARRAYFLFRLMLLGKTGGGFGYMVKRMLIAAFHVVGQWCQFKNLSIKDRSQLGHVFMAWGFLTYAPFYLIFIIIGAGFGLSEMLENTSFFFYYAWVMDIGAPFIILGALWGIIRRYIVKPPRLEGEQTIEAAVILGTVLIHPMTHLFKEATSIALGHPPVGLGSVLPPISTVLSHLFSGSSVSSVQTAGIGFFWTHWGFVLFVLVFIAYSRYLHMVAAPFNILLRSLRPKGALSPIDFETAETFGVSKITDFTWKQLLDCYSCVVCGQCQDACPAYASGKPLNPKKVIQDIKKHLLEVGPKLLKVRGKAGASSNSPDIALVGEVVTEDELWACTTCRACQEVCPVSNEHIDKIVDMRRNLVLEQTRFPETLQDSLKSLGTRGHPWRGTTLTRTDWCKDLKVKTLSESSGETELLYWVGCTAALDERNTKVAVAIAKILQAAGVNFAILGEEERCCGDPARRAGDEYLFQTLCQQNIKVFQSYNVKKILTSCPHGFNVFKNEYPQFGGNFEVVHHSQFIADLIRQGRLKLDKLDNMAIAYHDSCYLGRYNDIYAEPREILKNLKGVRRVELPRCRERGFCCGGGGGHMWLEEPPDKRVNVRRVEEVIGAKVDVVATACPYCLIMFEDGLKAKGVEETIKANDISELVIKAAGLK